MRNSPSLPRPLHNDKRHPLSTSMLPHRVKQYTLPQKSSHSKVPEKSSQPMLPRTSKHCMLPGRSPHLVLHEEETKIGTTLTHVTDYTQCTSSHIGHILHKHLICSKTQSMFPVTRSEWTVYRSGCYHSVLVCILVLSLWVHAVTPCYVYPADVRDPCHGKLCSFGAKCVPSLDGLTARCQCRERCDNYGNSVGSQPICGDDGKDYTNQCELERTSCRQMKVIKPKYNGTCGEYTLTLSPLNVLNAMAFST